MPPPPALTRETTSSMVTGEDVDGGTGASMYLEPDPEMVVRYLTYDCRYKRSKYQDPHWTWGELVKNDYNHFLELMCFEVPLDSNTFMALRTHLRPGDENVALNTIRTRDTSKGCQDSQEQYLNYTCTHKGRMNGKTWREVREKDYSYFIWAVGNTMGRDTKSFNVLKKCMKEEDQALIDKSPKGSLQVPRNKVWQK